MTQSPSTGGLEIEVRNFGPIVEAKLDLRPFTVLIGPSNSGKSYLSILIYALHCALAKYDDVEHEIRRVYQLFPKENLQELQDWIAKNFNRRENSIRNNSALVPGSFDLPKGISELICTFFGHTSKFSQSVVEYEIKRCFQIGSVQELIRRAGSQRTAPSVEAAVKLRKSTRSHQNSIESIAYNFQLNAKGLDLSVVRSAGMPLSVFGPRNDLDVNDICRAARAISASNSSMRRALNDQDAMDQLCEVAGASLVDAVIANSIDPLGRLAHYFPADRAGVIHTHHAIMNTVIAHATSAGIKRSPDTPVLSGVLGDFLSRLVGMNYHPSRPRQHRMFSAADHHCEFLAKVSENLESNVLEGRVHSEGLNNSVISYPNFSYQPHGWSDSLPLIRASSMVSELSPIVLYLRRVVAPGDVLIIEEPEAHLHPGLQIKFVELLAEIIKAGVRIILTTHSVYVLDAVANLLLSSKIARQGEDNSNAGLSSKDVGIWSFVRKKRPRGSVVEEIEFDIDEGGFATEFDDVAIDTHNKWAELSSHLSQKEREAAA